MTIKVDMREIVELEKDLGVFARKAMPFATRQTLTGTAFKAREHAQNEIQSRFQIRSRTYLPKSVAVTQARGLDVSRQFAAVGSIRDVGLKLESGETQDRASVPTPYSSGESRGARPRKRAVRRPNRWNRVRPARQRGSGPQARIRTIKAAASRPASQRFAVIDTRRGRALVKLVGGKRNSRVEVVQGLPTSPVRTPAQPWLKPAVLKAQKDSPAIYLKAMQYQARRHRLFGYRGR